MPAPLTVLNCLPEPAGPSAAADPAAGDAAARSPWLAGARRLVADQHGHQVGPRPGKQIDPLLAGRVLVIGDDADLAAVVLRLLRTERLGSVEVSYVSRLPTPFSTRRRLPTGPAGLRVAGQGGPRPVTLLRDDSGGVLLERGEVVPVTGLVYADEHRILAGPAAGLSVSPDPERGLTVTITARRRLRWFGGGQTSTNARAVQITGEPMTPVKDGVPHPRPVGSWIWYRHTEPLLLVDPQPASAFRV